MTQVAIVTQDDPFYMPLFFQEFFPRIRDATIERVTVLDILDESTLAFTKRMLFFYGPVNFVRRSLGYAARKVLDTLGTGTYSVASVAQQYGVPVEERANINAAEYVNWIQENSIDVLLSVSASQIFQEELLNAPNEYCLNVHTAKLPEYRGMLPTFWALYHGEENIGSTVHTMVPEVDRGEIVNQTTFPVESDMTLDEAIKRGKREGGKLAAQSINEISDGTISTSEMAAEGSYFSFPTRKQRREFQRRGNRLL